MLYQAQTHTMKSIILFVILVIQCLVFGDPQEDWYKSQIVTNILPLYIQAHDTLEAGILNELVAVNVTLLDESAVGQLVNRLYCAIRKTHVSLEQSVSISENLQVEVNARLTFNVAQAGAYERSITDIETGILQTDESLKSALNQLAAAEQAVIEKQNGVAKANEGVREAEEAVEEARKCRGKRSWFSRITRPIVRPVENAYKDVVIKPICSVVNSGGIDNAKDRRGSAEQQLASAREQEQHFRQVVIEKQTMKTNLEGQFHQLRASLASTQSALQTLQTELAVTININQQVKQRFLSKTSLFVSRSLFS